MRKSTGASLILSLVMGSPLLAQEIAAIDSISGELTILDMSGNTIRSMSGPGLHLTTWTALARDGQGQVWAAGTYINGSTTDLYIVDTNTGQFQFQVEMDRDGVFAMAFGPNDVLYAVIDDNYPMTPRDFALATIDTATGTTQPIGWMGDDQGILGMAFNGTTMYVDGIEGLQIVDLNTGNLSDIDPWFSGALGLTRSICFGPHNEIFAVDFGLWITEPATGISSLVHLLDGSLYGDVEFLPGPNPTLSLWTTERAGNIGEVRVRGATSYGEVALFASSNSPGATIIPPGYPCAGTILDLHPQSIRFLRTATADANGEVVFGPTMMPAGALRTSRLQAVDLTACMVSNPSELYF